MLFYTNTVIMAPINRNTLSNRIRTLPERAELVRLVYRVTYSDWAEYTYFELKRCFRLILDKAL